MTTKNNYKNFEEEYQRLNSIHEEISNLKKFNKLYHHEILLRDVVNTAESVVVVPELTERIQALIDERLNELEKEINEKYGLTMKG